MICFILTAKYVDPMSGNVWTEEPIPQPAPQTLTLLHPLQYATNVKCAPRALAMDMIAKGAWQKVGEFDDGRPDDPQRVNWKAKGAAVTEQPGMGPTLREQSAKPPKPAASVKDKA